MKRAIPLLFSTLAVVACSRKAEPTRLTSAEPMPSDDELAVRVDERLGQAAHMSLAARDVSVSVQNGIATLRGKVSSSADREAIHVIADGTPGISGLSDQLVVAPEGPTSAESDQVITQAALHALRTDPSLRTLADRLDLRCTAGVVRIRREVLTEAQDRAVTRLLEKLPGVIVVTDR